MKNNETVRPLGCLVFSLALLLLLLTSGGCIKAVQKTMGTPVAGDTGSPASAGDPAGIRNGVTQAPRGSYETGILAKVTPQKTNITVDVSPILTPDPYPILHGTRINETPLFDFRYRQPEFERKYRLDGNATGLLVNVVEGPLYIVFVVWPQKDCLVDPDSCRGTMKSPVTRPFLKITVRDNETKEIVAEDGFGREFSSDTGNYKILVMERNSHDSAKIIPSEPGPRYIPIYREGVFHITLEGNNLDVNLSVITGSSPDPLDLMMQSRTNQSSPATTPPPEEEDAWA